jgi:hypothetical protein
MVGCDTDIFVGFRCDFTIKPSSIYNDGVSFIIHTNLVLLVKKKEECCEALLFYIFILTYI